MDSGVLLCLVCVLSVVEVPAIRADFCSSYSDYSGDYHDTKQCGLMYCCGDCSDRYCCSDKSKELSYSQQKKCPDSPTHSKMSRVPLIIGGVLGALLPAIFCVTLIICCVAPCCICYKLCRKRRRPQTKKEECDSLDDIFVLVCISCLRDMTSRCRTFHYNQVFPRKATVSISAIVLMQFSIYENTQDFTLAVFWGAQWMRTTFR
ncbi:protein shisa-4-like isoform X2 [Gouania willdenowi]|uniref:protein shisa-4-like isoform X2 n=1 Tax=Gouania willdenowi TaxID=441366 RepID=UPI001056C79E|nr:protein shisa-4-like isoform X2 [Gouania willdenowi]